MSKWKIFRGISNIAQLENILKNKTAGGWGVKKDSTWENSKSTLDLIKIQKGTDAERISKVVDIDDTQIHERQIVEYTFDSNVAKGFGLVGVICVNIDSKYSEEIDTKDTEKSIFCLSTAPVEIVSFKFNENFAEHEKYNKLKDKVDNFLLKKSKCIVC